MKIVYDNSSLKVVALVDGYKKAVVENTDVVWIQYTGERFFGCSVVDVPAVSGLTDKTLANYSYDPSARIIHTKRLLPLEAYDRLTASERIAIRALAASDPVVADWLHRFDIVAYQNTPFEVGPGSNWHGGMSYLAGLSSPIISAPRLAQLTT
jgi:hypothetical protein